MSRKFFVMLIVTFLFQLSWGVASAYCLHETGQAGQHFGHHQHQHQPVSATADDGAQPNPQKATFHADCAACAHGALVAPVQQRTDTQALPERHAARAASPAPPALYADQPDRPQWDSAA